MTVEVTDADLNTDDSTAETVDVTVTSSNGESETVTLTETGVDTGVFSGMSGTTIGLGAGTDDDGAVNAQNGDVLTATYSDVENTAGVRRQRLWDRLGD